MDNTILLSVCIPTYNGESHLSLCLETLIRAVNNRNDVEIIVSDNCSIDNTHEILERFKLNNRIHVHTNQNNLGFNGNIKLIIDELSKGKYTWIIGDDDIVDFDSIDILCELLSEKDVDFICINYRMLSYDEVKIKKRNENRHVEGQIGHYFKALDNVASAGNILGTFMSSQIFKTEVIRQFDKSVFGANDWTNFKTTFPNSYMMTQSFYASKKCLSIKEPLLTALLHEKSWDDKLYIVSTKILPDYLDYCLSICANPNDLENNCRLIEKAKCSYYLKDIFKFRINYSIISYLIIHLPKVVFLKIKDTFVKAS